ncbi:MAG TPA: hypothetical protein DC000_07215 [Clostridiales bacterium]|nr:hypothetical protein [Clostridiales bacterium]
MKDIYNEYSREINDILYDLDRLKNGKYYELTNNKSDGTAAYRAERIDKNIKELLLKINNDTAGMNTKIKNEYDKFFNK